MNSDSPDYLGNLRKTFWPSVSSCELRQTPSCILGILTLIRCVWVFLFPIRVSVAVCLVNDNLKDIKNNWKRLITVIYFLNFMNRNKNNTGFINWDTFIKTDLLLLLRFHVPYMRYYKARLVYFLPLFSLRFIIKSGKMYKEILQ